MDRRPDERDTVLATVVASSPWRAAMGEQPCEAGSPARDADFAEFEEMLYSSDRGAYELVKGIVDVVIALILIVLLLPVLAAIALAIRLDSPGPVIFHQQRIGRYGRPFKMFKFRTMVPERRVCAGPPPAYTGERRRRHKGANDPRVTRVGRILRRTSLDELPQLGNVLRRDMSLVGPRPEIPAIVASYEPWQHLRHAALPGITGWWQVNRDGDRLMHEATEYDLHYVKNCSLALDLKILLMTVGTVVTGRGAF